MLTTFSASEANSRQGSFAFNYFSMGEEKVNNDLELGADIENSRKGSPNSQNHKNKTKNLKPISDDEEESVQSSNSDKTSSTGNSKKLNNNNSDNDENSSANKLNNSKDNDTTKSNTETKQEFCVKPTNQEFKLRLVPLERLLCSSKKAELERQKNKDKQQNTNNSTATTVGRKRLPQRSNRKNYSVIEISSSENSTDEEEIIVPKRKETTTSSSSTSSIKAPQKSATISNNYTKKEIEQQQKRKWHIKRCVVRIKRVAWPDHQKVLKQKNNNKEVERDKSIEKSATSNKTLPKSNKTIQKRVISSSESESSKKMEATSTSKRFKRNSSDDDSDFELSKDAHNKSDTENEQNKSSGDDDDDDVQTSDSEVIPTRKKRIFNKKKSEDEDSDFEPESKRKKGKNRRRIKTGSDDEDDDGDEDNDGKGKINKKRKEIRKVIKTKDLDVSTKEAAKEEQERRKRIEERQKLYNQIYERPETEEISELVLDFDEETKEPLLKVDPGILKKLKPHQVTGVKFMWDACFETLKDANDKSGSGCILAHCMGLGKTLQVVTLSHTLLSNSRKTQVERVLIISPLSTLNNWAREFKHWMSFTRKRNIEIYDMSRYRDKNTRIFKLNEWFEEGGVCILGYDMYRILTNEKAKGLRKKQREDLQRALVEPGPDLVICDEGHLLKNEKTSISKAVTRMRTKRRIVLTGTPLQNNLKEYYCMIQFIKPNLLGTYKEYLNRFVNPITNGQYTDSTERDIRLMKHRSHILHKLLEGCIQRRDYSVLAPYLPPKHEYVVYTTLSDLQQTLYEFYMTTQRDQQSSDVVGKGARLFQDFQDLRRIWTHPMNLRVNSDVCIRKRIMADDENSLEDFICDDDEDDDEGAGGSNRRRKNDDSSSDESSAISNKSFGSGDGGNNGAIASVSNKTHRTRANKNLNGNNDNDDEMDLQKASDTQDDPSEWWKRFVDDADLNNIHHSPKLVILMQLLQQCEAIGDKLLVFSQSLQSLDVIEHFLSLIDSKTHGHEYEGDVGDFKGTWKLGVDYFRLDGSSSVENREDMCKRFNDVTNLRARLFLISTRAGGLGINLVAANRVVIFDVSWNPSHDTQSIFRVYRFGQEKPCYIYRLIAMGTMEQKVYERQVTKQATAKRVIDEQQITRHYNSSDLQELYTYELEPSLPREIPILPKDRLFAELLTEREKLIYKYHEHDSLLENEESENLSEEDRKAAWSEYEAEKTRATTTAQYVAYDRTAYANTSGNVTSNRIFGFRSDVLLQLLNMKVSKDHPEFTNTQVLQLVPQYLSRLYAEMNSGDPTLYKDLLLLNTALTHPSGMYMNPLLYANQNPNAAGYYQAPSVQQQGQHMQQQQQPQNIVPNPNAPGFAAGEVYEID